MLFSFPPLVRRLVVRIEDSAMCTGRINCVAFQHGELLVFQTSSVSLWRSELTRFPEVRLDDNLARERSDTAPNRDALYIPR